MHEAREQVGRFFGAGALLQITDEREQPLVAIDDPDARLGAREAAQDERHLAGGRLAGTQFQQLRTIVQRSRNRTRGGEERLLLAFAQQALHLLHVHVADERDHREHEGHEHHLRPQRETHGQPFQR